MRYQNRLTLYALAAGLGLTCAAVPVQAAHDDDESLKAQRKGAAATSAPAGGLGRVSGENRLIGSTVTSRNNQKLGEVDDIVVDLESGRVLYVIIDTQGEKRAVPPAVLGQGQTRGNQVNLRLKGDAQLLRDAPRFAGNMDDPSRLGQASYISQVYKHFGQSAWWQGPNAPANTGSFNNVHKASDLPGTKVRDVSDREIGQVNHVMMNLPRGRVVYVIFDPSDKLTQNNQDLYALPPNALTLHRDGKTLVTSLTQDKLASAPHFNRRNWPNLSDLNYGSRVYEFYGKQAYFDRGSMTPTGRNSVGSSGDEQGDIDNSASGQDDSDEGYQEYERNQDRGFKNAD